MPWARQAVRGPGAVQTPGGMRGCGRRGGAVRMGGAEGEDVPGKRSRSMKLYVRYP
jgi:hypothetical protein